MMQCIYGVLNLWCAAYWLQYFFGVLHLWCVVSLVDCFSGKIYFWCCVFGAMHCQLHREGLLP